MCSVQRNLVTDGVDLTAVTDSSDGGGSRIIPRDRTGYQRPYVPGASMPTYGHEGGCVLLHPMGPTFTILVASHERECGREYEQERERDRKREQERDFEREFPSNVPTERHTRCDTPDPHNTGRKLEFTSQPQKPGNCHRATTGGTSRIYTR